MSSNFGSPSPNPNPYSSPGYYGELPQPGLRPRVEGIVRAPAIVLLVVSMLGLAASTFNVIFAFQDPMIDPNAPPVVQELQKGAVGPQAAIVQGLFVLLNLFIIAGCVQMMRLQTWGLALAACIAAMVNVGTFCCVLGLPIGIWGIVILVREDVKMAFRSPAG